MAGADDTSENYIIDDQGLLWFIGGTQKPTLAIPRKLVPRPSSTRSRALRAYRNSTHHVADAKSLPLEKPEQGLPRLCQVVRM